MKASGKDHSCEYQQGTTKLKVRAWVEDLWDDHNLTPNYLGSHLHLSYCVEFISYGTALQLDINYTTGVIQGKFDAIQDAEEEEVPGLEALDQLLDNNLRFFPFFQDLWTEGEGEDEDSIPFGISLYSHKWEFQMELDPELLPAADIYTLEESEV